MTDHHVLTAAHCCIHQTEVYMYFGNARKGRPRATGDFMLHARQADWVMHEKYMKRDDDGNEANYDVCIIKTSQNIQTVAEGRCSNPYCISRACLPDAAPVHGKNCWIAGWGKVEEEAKYDHPGQLRQAGLNIFTKQVAGRNTYARFTRYPRGTIQPDEFIAGLPVPPGGKRTKGGVDTCQGDSGGPLICDVDGVAVVTGITSRGGLGRLKCGSDGLPGIYGNVFVYKQWIDDIIRGSNALLRAESVDLATFSQDKCCVPHVVLDGREVTSLTNIKTYSADECQAYCQENYAKGCRYYVWKKCTNKCELYHGLDGLEHDDGRNGNCLGSVHGCFASECYQAGFDYEKRFWHRTSAVDDKVFGVGSVDDCLDICRLHPSCKGAR